MPEASTIRGIRAREVVVPARGGSTDSESLGGFMSGVPWHHMPIVVIEFRFSDGIVALGEVARGVTLQSVQSGLQQLIDVPVRGPSLAALPAAFRAAPMWNLYEAHAPPLWASPSPLVGALEMALLDWAGRRLGCSVVDLLGGAYRQRVPVDYWCGRQTPDDLTRLIERARAKGFTGLKMKSRIGDPTMDQLRAIKSAGGENFGVTIDPMFQWHSPHDALHLFRQMESMPHVRIEDPYPQDMPEHWRRTRATNTVPLIWHARGIDSLRRCVEGQCADAFNCSGSIHEFLTIAHAVESLGYSCWHGSMAELGVGQVAHLHAAAAARSCVMASDFVSGFVREHTLIEWDWPYGNGSLPLPGGNGLGVSLDQAAVTAFAKAQWIVGQF